MQVLPFSEVSGRVCPGVCMKPKMTPEVKAYFQAITSMGGKARAKALSAKRRREIATTASKAAAKARAKKAKTGARKKV